MPNELTAPRPLDVFDIEHEPRIRDLDLAERLGFERVYKIRELIYRNKAELETYGPLPYRDAIFPHGGEKSKRGRGRPTTECWLNEGQALLVCLLARTERAATVRKQVIEAYQAWRQKTVPVKQHMRRPPAHPARLWTPGGAEPGFQLRQPQGSKLVHVSTTCTMATALAMANTYFEISEALGVFA